MIVRWLIFTLPAFVDIYRSKLTRSVSFECCFDDNLSLLAIKTWIVTYLFVGLNLFERLDCDYECMKGTRLYTV